MISNAFRRATFSLARRAVSSSMVFSTQMSIRSMATFNPFVHTNIAIDSKKPATKLDLGDGKTIDIPARMDVKANPEHEPPYRLSGEVGKITSTIFTFASSKGELAVVEKDFKTIQDTLLPSPAWINTLGGAGGTKEEKLAVLSEFLKVKKMSPFTSNLLPYFVEQKLLKHLPKVTQTFLDVCKAKRGELEVTVTSAEPLDKTTLKNIESMVVAQVGKGSKVNFTSLVDSELLAGLRIQYKDILIDNTVSRKIDAETETWRKAYYERITG